MRIEQVVARDAGVVDQDVKLAVLPSDIASSIGSIASAVVHVEDDAAAGGPMLGKRGVTARAPASAGRCADDLRAGPRELERDRRGRCRARRR